MCSKPSSDGAYNLLRQMPTMSHLCARMMVHRRGFERFLRKVLKHPSKPALLYFHVYQPWHNMHSFWLGPERELEIILQYYSIPTVSARDALYLLGLYQAHGFADDDMHCDVHPNPLGHRCFPPGTLVMNLFGSAVLVCPWQWSPFGSCACRPSTGSWRVSLNSKSALCRYYGDMVIAALQDEAYAALTIPEEHMQYPHVFELLTAIPPPVLEENWDFDSECLTGEPLRQVMVPELSEVSKLQRSVRQQPRHTCKCLMP